jgi:hypothetical protein
MSLSASTQRSHSAHLPRIVPIPAKASAVIWSGAIVCTDAGGVAVPGADTAGLVPQGIAWRGIDNTGGADGSIAASSTAIGSARYVDVDDRGEWEFTVSAGSPKVGLPAFVVDDDTVSANATTNSLKIGTFTRPGLSATTWFVDVARR